MPKISDIINDVNGSGCLGNSTRQVKLLEYLLREADEGRAERIKAYSVALDVLGRDESFDSSVDSIVRVEMHRLRKNLALYNSGDYRFEISLPKGSYHIAHCRANAKGKNQLNNGNAISIKTATIGAIIVACTSTLIGFFIPNHSPSNNTTNQACVKELPFLTINPTIIRGKDKTLSMVPAMIDNDLQVGLSQYNKVQLLPKEGMCANKADLFYDIETTLFNSTNAPYLSVRVTHTNSQTIIFTRRLQLDVGTQKGRAKLRNQLYQIGSQIGHGTGVVPNDAISRNWTSQFHKSRYQCWIIATKEISIKYFTENLKDGLCLKELFEGGDRHPDTLGLLASFYILKSRGQKNLPRLNLLAQSADVLKIAMNFAPENSDILMARLRLESESTPIDRDNMRDIIGTIENREPYNFYLLQSSALLAGFKLGDWQHANMLANRANALNYTRARRVLYVPLVASFLYGTNQETRAIYESITPNGDIVENIYCLGIGNKIGATQAVSKCRKILALNGLKTKAQIVEYASRYQREPVLQKEILKWLTYSPEKKEK